MDLEF